MLSFKNMFSTGNARSAMLRRNILFSMLIKVMSVLCSLIVVPLTLNYLLPLEYGVWLTLSSVLIWFSFFDVGLGNGLRNYLTQAISKGDYQQGNRYLSTTFCLLCILCFIFFAIFGSLSYFLDLSELFKITMEGGEDALRVVVLVAVLFTLMNFVVKNVGVVFMSLQKYAYNDLLVFLGHAVALAVIWILTKCTDGSLLYVTIAFTASPVLVFILAGVFLFIKYPQLKISPRKVDFSLTRLLMGKGLSFFVIQVTSCLVIFGSSNLFITHYCGPETVTEYNIAYKLFNVITLGFTILISPLWSAYTDAYVKSDYAWIRKMFNRSLVWWCLTLMGAGFLLIASPVIYAIWIKDAVTVPFVLSAAVCIYLCLFNFNNCVTYLLNGLNIVRVQLITSVLVTLLYFVLVYIFAPRYGVIGISLSMSVCYFIQGAIHLYQCRLIITQHARGIWLR